MSFKCNLKNELKYQDIQLKELSGRIGVPYGTILSYVNHQECIPNVYIAYKIAKELDVSLEYLVTGKREDKLKNKYISLFNELTKLPSSEFSAFEQIIHSMYELLKNKEMEY